MSVKSERVRALVCERLSAAAEDICALFERTIAEYEEELSRSKEENERKQKLLDSVLSPRVLVHRAAIKFHSLSPDLSLNQEITERPQIKKEPEEHGIKQEEEPLPESTATCVKQEIQSSLLQQRQKKHREETEGEEFDYERFQQFYSENIEDDEAWTWEPAASSSTPQMETEADGDHHNQVQIKDTSTAAPSSALFTKYKSAAETPDTGKEGGKPGAGGGKRKKYECCVCKKSFTTKQSLVVHTRVHTGERPYSCSTCERRFRENSKLKIHMRIHTGEKPYSCPVCGKAFSQRCHLTGHMNTHGKDKPFCCTICKKTFIYKSAFIKHRSTHTGLTQQKNLMFVF